MKTGSLVEHTNSINTVTDLLTVSKIDLMALSSGNVGLPGRPPLHIVDRLFNCSSDILPCLGDRGPRPPYLELRENYICTGLKLNPLMAPDLIWGTSYRNSKNIYKSDFSYSRQFFVACRQKTHTGILTGLPKTGPNCFPAWIGWASIIPTEDLHVVASN